MTGEKTKLYNRLQGTFELFYTALQITEQLPANDRTSELLSLMDSVNAELEKIMENQWWQKLEN